VVSRTAFINKLRELNYTYKRPQKRTELWRKKGGTHCVLVPMRDLIEDETVISNLRQAGCSEDNIKAFMAAAKS
jgi:hypothetical protein